MSVYPVQTELSRTVPEFSSSGLLPDWRSTVVVAVTISLSTTISNTTIQSDLVFYLTCEGRLFHDHGKSANLSCVLRIGLPEKQDFKLQASLVPLSDSTHRRYNFL